MVQGSQTRYFGCDSLKRLIRVKNPEQDINSSIAAFTDPVTSNAQWALAFSYDSNSNLSSKTDPRNITCNFAYDAMNRVLTRTFSGETTPTRPVDYKYDGAGTTAQNALGKLTAVNTSGSQFVKISYVYDALNRVTSRSYNDGTPAVAYKYNGTGVTGGVLYSKGKLTQVSSSVSSCSYEEYDQMGRVKQSTQTTDNNPYHFSYGYDLASNQISQTYPSGKEIKTTYDAAGRISDVKRYINSVFDKTYASGFSYAAHGAVSAVQLGNGKWEHTNFNNRLQPTQIGLGTSGTDSSILKLDYGYGTTANNGNLLSQTITAPGLTLNQCYGYDSLNRLTTAEEHGGGTVCAGTQQWKQAFTCDRYGNRNFDVANTTSNVLGPNPTIGQSNNRIAPGQNYGYDNAGNLTSEPTTPVNGIVYDAENRQTQYTKTGQPTNYYYYDGDGRRVKKIDANGTTVFVYNAGGQLIAEYHSHPVPPAAGGGGTSYLTSDHLGSTRVVTKQDGTVKARYDYLPFGEEIPSSVGGRSSVVGYSAADSTKQKFTQKERDNESGLDWFGPGRYYSSPQGHFTSADPITVTPPRMVDPQQLNLYAYVRNNPLAYIDPTGMVIDVGRLSEDDLKKWKRVEELANRKDDKGNYVNSKLREVYELLQSDKRTFFIENHSFGDKSGTIGETNITKHNGKDDFTEAVIQIDFKKAKNLATTTAADLVAGFNKFEGLLDQGDKGADARLAEVFGHEGGHGIYDLNNPAEGVKMQMLLTDRDAALKAMPKGTKYPYPPDVMQKMANADRALIPTERFAQQTEKIINGELRATLKRK